MKFLKGFSLKFSDPQMEEQFSAIKDQRIIQDFLMVICFLLIMHTLVVVPSLIKEYYTDVYITLVPVTLLVISFLMRKRWQKYTQHLVLVGLFSYNCSRLVSLIYSYPGKVEARMYFQGYSYGTIQAIVIIFLHKVPYKVFGIIVSYIVRMSVILGAIDGRAFDALLIIRHFTIDLFLMWTFYSYEKTARKVFQDYYENREELVKFKELLDDSLPQSVTILDCISQKPLFSNNCFKNTFEHHKVETDVCMLTDQALIHMPKKIPEAPKPNLSSLTVDITTIREIGELHSQFKLEDWSNDHAYLDETLKKLILYNLLSENRVLSLTASYTSQGQHRLFEVILRRIKWDRSDAVAIILNDITYRENIMSLKVANQTKDTIIATISHELRTPLHGIIGLLESTEKKAKDPEISDHLSLCKSNMYLLWNLVNSLLDFHHISTGNLRLNLVRTNVRRVLKDIIKLFQFQADLKKLVLSLKVSQDVPYYIITDKDRLKQILVTLISNAIKFTFYGGVKVEVTQDPDHMGCLRISVADTGIGIKPEDRAKLFKINEKQESGTNVRKNGVGLNLTIANNLTEALNENAQKHIIRVKSEEGIGSMFYFCLTTNLHSENPTDATIGPKNSNSKKPFLTEDEEDKKALRPFCSDLHIANVGNFLRRKSEANNRENAIHDGENSDSMSSDWLEESETLIDIESKLATYTNLKRTSQLKSYSKGIGLEESQKQVLHPQRVSWFYPPSNDKDSQECLELPKSSDREVPLQIHNHRGYVLIVDDTPLNLLVAEHLIKSLGYPIKTALSGHEAIKVMQVCAVEGQPIRAILMDCQMPVMDGYETTKALIDMMGRNEIQKAPVIAWTANNGDEDIRRCYECGMIGHLTKPTSKENLLKALSNIG